jgi:hypothetical protein
MVDLPAYGANSAPTDRFWMASAAVGFALGSAADKYITANDFCAEITRNVTDISLQFGSGSGVSTVSAANKGKIRYDSAGQSFQVSENGGAYQNLLKGSGTATRVAFWSVTSDELSSDAALYWDNTNKRLSVGVGTSPGAPIDVLAESISAIAQQWRPNTGTMRAVMILDGGPETFLGTTTPHNFHLITNGLQRLSIENSSGNVGINKASLIAAQLQVVANAATTKPLILNSAPATSVNLAEFYNDSSIRFTFGNAGNLLLGKAGASGATGSLTFAVNGQANTQTLQGGDTPVSTNAFKWPNADPTAGQALTASAPSGGIVTLSWTTPSAGATINPTNLVMPVRQDATTFIDSSLTITATTLALSQATAVRTSGTPTFYNRILTPADTTLTASAESVGIQFGGNTSAATVTRQWATGALTTQREYLFVAPTYAFVGASTLTTAATVTITNAPQAGTNATITNAFALLLQAGSLRITDAGSSTFPALQIFTDKRGIYATTGALAVADSNSAITAGLGISGAGFTGLLSVPSSGAFAIGSTTSAIAAFDLAITRHAANVFRMTNASTGIGSVLIGTSTDSLTGNFTVMSSNAATATIVTVARLGVNSTGTAADGFGAALSWSAETSTTNDTETGRINVFWTTATHASRTSAISFSLTNNATLAEVARIGTPSNNVGSPFVLTVHDGTNPNVWTAGAFAAKLYLISPTLPAVGVAAHFSATALDAPQWQMLRGRGSNASPTAIQSSDSIGNLEWWGQTSTSTNNVVAGARIRVSATENWSAGNNGCQMIFFTSNNAGTITDRMYLKETGTLRVGATSGSYNTTTLVQVGNYASWNTDAVAAIYTGANGTKGLEIIGTASATASPLRVFRDSLTPDLLNLAASGVLSLRAGLNTGTTALKVGGTIKEDFNSNANSGTAETNLTTYSLPASTMGTDNDYVEIDAWGEFTSAVSNKTVKLYFGSTVIFSTSALAFGASAWRIKAVVTRGSSTTQVAISTFSGNTTLLTTTAQVASPGETMSGAITIKCTGQSSVGSNEIFQEGLIVKYYPASN